MRKLLKKIGYINHHGKLDKKEIVIDVSVVLLVLLITYTIEAIL